MPMSLSEFRYARRVQFHETDMAGLVHFSCFFQYVEEAEHAMWRAAGLSPAPRTSGVGFPRVAASLDFRSPLRFEDEFEVAIRIAAVTNKTIRYACTMTREGECIAEGSMTVISVMGAPDGNITGVPLPAEVRAAFQVHPDTNELSLPEGRRP